MLDRWGNKVTAMSLLNHSGHIAFRFGGNELLCLPDVNSSTVTELLRNSNYE